MNIDYRTLLPESSTCDHLYVKWVVTDAEDETYVLVSVGCRGCPAHVIDQQVEAVS